MPSEAERTERVRNQGKPDGLFRACMDTIRKSHSVGQALRGAALAAGLMSDARCYAELLGQFYVATEAMERRMDDSLASGDADSFKVLRRVKELGYNFRTGYEQDLEHLLGLDWKRTLGDWTTNPAKIYAERLEVANEMELAAAAFILWGPLIIGGGAALKPRVQKAFGAGATGVFQDVIGVARGGRSARRREFIETYDELLSDEEDDNKRSRDFAEIVKSSADFMALNNEMMVAVKQRPWWSKYVWGGVVVVAGALAWRYKAPRQ